MLQLHSAYFGMALAFSASLFWTFAPLLFASAGRKIGAYNLNVLRLSIASLLLLSVTSCYLLLSGKPVFPGMTPATVALFAISGITGLVAGDLFYLKALTMLGPRRTVLIFILSPIVPVVIAWIYMGERLTWQAMVGIAMIIAGLAVSTVHDSRPENRPGAEPGEFSFKGVWLALAATVLQGIAAVLARQGFVSAPQADPVVATATRVVSAGIAMIILTVCMGKFFEAFGKIRHPGAAVPIVLGTLTGPVCGMLLYVSAFKYTAAGIVTTLASLSPLLILPVVAIRYRAKIKKEAIAGTIIALAGVALIALGK